MLRLRDDIEDLRSSADRAYNPARNNGQAGFCYLGQARSLDVNLRESARETSVACFTASDLDCCQSLIENIQC